MTEVKVRLRTALTEEIPLEGPYRVLRRRTRGFARVFSSFPQDPSSENQDGISPPTGMCLWAETGPALWGLADLLVPKWPSDPAVPVALVSWLLSAPGVWSPAALCHSPSPSPAGVSTPISAHSSHSVMACVLALENRPSQSA